MIFEQTVDRLREVATGQPSTATRQRMRVEAEELTLAGLMQAQAVIINEAIARCSLMLYELGADGYPANYDHHTGRILIPVPWGSEGWAKWGLRKWEAEALRKIWKARLKQGWPMLYDYSKVSLRWYLRVDAYPTSDHAMQWVQAEQVGVKEWRKAVDYMRSKRKPKGARTT